MWLIEAPQGSSWSTLIIWGRIGAEAATAKWSQTVLLGVVQCL
jgi:hypothetical protein